ncbi:DUF4367 domain-containing protein [Bacillaceae bacterium IKA-2]|nr:DUF4367 domain-containing protein [Bacillaceae bacterium IKA-2]
MKNNKWNKDNEQLIEEAIKENFDNVPDPLLSKEASWEEIQKKKEPQKSDRPKKYMKRVVVAAIIMTVISLSLFKPQSTSAFNWVTNFFTKAQGTVTQLMGTLGNSPPPDENQPIPEIERHLPEINVVRMSIEEANEVASFDIVIPSYVPEGFKFRDITVELIDDKKSDQMILNYVKGEETLTIRETNIQEQTGYSMGVDNEDTDLIEEVDIQGNKGTLLVFKDGSKKLIWVVQEVQFIIDSQLSEEEKIKIAINM